VVGDECQLKEITSATAKPKHYGDRLPPNPRAASGSAGTRPRPRQVVLGYSYTGADARWAPADYDYGELTHVSQLSHLPGRRHDDRRRHLRSEAHRACQEERRQVDGVAYAKDKGMAGVLVWALGHDLYAGRPVLLDAIARKMGVAPADPPIEYLKKYDDRRIGDAKKLSQEIVKAQGETTRLGASGAARVGRRHVDRFHAGRPFQRRGLRPQHRRRRARQIARRCAGLGPF